jgi:glucose/arabinose dehydrogenase
VARRTLVLPLLLAAALAGCGDDGATMEASRTAAAPSVVRAAAPTVGRGLARARGGPRVGVIARGLEVPWDVAFLPSGAALVTERPGRVRLVAADGRLRARPLARVPVAAVGEGGLLGVAVDPDFAAGRRFVYLYATVGGEVQVQRWTLRAGRMRRAAAVLDGIRAGSVHDSGRLRFGPDRHLYVTTGDAGTGSLAQDRASRNGKVLRLRPAQYRGGRPARPEVYALGLRNPQGLDWQPRTNRLLVTDHGPSGFDGPSGDDEVNAVRRGANLGWPLARGAAHAGFAAPLRVYPQTIAPSGLAFVRRGGSSWSGDVLVAALKGRALRRLRLRGGRVTGEETLLAGAYGRLRAVVEAPDGAIWVTTSNRDGYGSPVSASDDRIIRVVPPRG